MLIEFEELNRLRFERDWTFGQLADAMREAKFPVHESTLHQLMNGTTAAPRDRTLYKVRQFLARIAAEVSTHQDTTAPKNEGVSL